MKALLAFEAVARCSSCTLAADELALTQSAVSHQVQVLEKAMGVKLFDRGSRALRMTEAGYFLQGELGKELDSIEPAIA